MDFLPSLLSKTPMLSVPPGVPVRFLVAACWLVFAALLVYLGGRWWGYQKPFRGRNLWLFIILLVIAPLSSLLFGVQLSAEGALPPRNLPVDFSGPVLMVFSALPWVLAGGFLGPAAAGIIAAFSGIFLAVWGTHSLFTPLELAFFALCFGAAMNQRYRTVSFRLLRHPLFASFLLSSLYPLVFIVTTSLSYDGAVADRLDYALTLVGRSSIAFAGSFLIAGLFAEVVVLGFPLQWGKKGDLQPSPGEKSLQARFLLAIAPLFIILLATLLVVDWVMAGDAAYQIMEGRMKDSALMASKAIPYFLDVGQSEVSKLAVDERLRAVSTEELTNVLAENIIRVPFFNQFYLLDSSEKLIASYPPGNYETNLAPPEEGTGIHLAIQGVENQTYSIPPVENGRTAQVSFIARIMDQDNRPWRVLVARADLEENPFTAPIINSLQSMEEMGGEGLLLDESGRLLYHPDPALLMETYTGKIPDSASFFDDTAPDGTRRLVYYQPSEGRPWAVVLSTPAQHVQQIALNIIAPVLLLIGVLAVVFVFLLRWRLRAINASLQTLASQAGIIARGDLDEPLEARGEDEVGQLRRAFEQMRLSLKLRLEEINRLLAVVQGVASNLEMGDAVQPVLDSALASGASSARIALDPAMVPELDGGAKSPVIYSAGPKKDLYQYLDQQIIALTKQQNRLMMPNILRPRLLRFPLDASRPESITALALRHENQYYGALWVAYDQPHVFTEDEIRFAETLAGQAALAAANARLYLNAEIGRQRLSAILTSSPDPVLVTDQQNRLLLANPAAWQVLGLGAELDEGKPVSEVISHKELLALLDGKAEDKRSAEVKLADGRVFFAAASSVFAEGHRVGRVCVLRDITSFKNLDKLKSEFVATVSHDLRSPLSLVRGYASMLEMVGAVNEPQTAYIRKIIDSVDKMTHLIGDLLDVGRIDAGVDLKIQKFSVREVIDQVISSQQSHADQSKVKLSVDIPQHVNTLVEADKALIQQALHNLVENAIKYNRPNGTVHLQVDERQSEMLFIIKDTGNGISPLDQPRLFEKFYRGAAQAGSHQHGTGMGLAIVKSIAERHHGKVWLESQLGKGSTFYFSIPINRAKPGSG